MVNIEIGQKQGASWAFLVIVIMMSSLLFPPMTIGTGDLVIDSIIPINSPIDNSPAVDMTTEIENILNNITEDLVQSRIQELQDFGTRYSYALEKNYAAGEYIYESFLSNGLETEYDTFVYNGHPARNVVAELPGKTASDQIFIICGHYDSTSGIPYKLAPGADDNGSGTAGVMVAAEVLSDYEFNHTIRFIAFSVEEQGMKGSVDYVNNALISGDNISGVINLDMIAFNPDTGTNFVNICPDFDDAGVSTDLINFANQTAQKYEHISNIRTFDKPYGSSDHAPFAPSFPAFMFIEKEWQSNPNYHQPTDTLAALNMTYCANVTQVAVAIMAELAEMRSSDNSSPSMRDIFPDDGGYGSENTTISLEILDPSLIDPTSVKLFVNGTEISPLLTPIPLGFNVSFTNPVDFHDLDIITINIIANDTAGNILNHNWTFGIDGVCPSIPTDINIDLVRIEMDKQGLVLDRGASGEYDDTHVIGPSVIFQDDEYKMWYAGHDGSRYRILYANSSDAINWVKYGLVLSIGSAGDPDDYHATYPSVIFQDNEYKMWYSGYDGAIWRILYANSTDGITWVKHGISLDLGSIGDDDYMAVSGCSVMYDNNEYKMWYSGLGDVRTILYANSTDGITWVKYGSPVLRNSIDGEYDTMIVISPSVVRTLDGYRMWYTGCSNDVVYRNLYANSTDGVNWIKQGLAIDIGAGGDADSRYAYKSTALIKDDVLHIWYTGYDGSYWRILYSKLTGNEPMTDISISWPVSSSNDVQYYDLIKANTPAELGSAGSFMKLRSNAYVDTGIGEGNSSNYYYTLKVVDKVGHVSQHSIMVGKIGVETMFGWNLLSSPFFEGDVPVEDALSSINWFSLQYYDAMDVDDHWKSNYLPWPDAFDEIDTVNDTMAIWAYINAGFFVTVGEVSNITIEMHAGWNFVSYPFHEERQVQDALFGLPYDMVEGYNSAMAYNLEVLTDTSMMVPGQGYWVHCTSASTWQAINT